MKKKAIFLNISYERLKMTFKTLIILLFTLWSSYSFAEDYASMLKNTPTNHFQLILNNLNMLSLARYDAQEANSNDLEEPHQKFIKFFESESGRLVAKGFYEAPVTLVKMSQCNDLVREARIDLVGNNPKLATMLRMVSYFDMTRSESFEIAKDAVVAVTLQAKENRELSISCSG